MSKREIEGDWVMGWPDRKRAELAAGNDAEGRVISGRTPILDQEGLITPTNNYYIVTQLDMPDPVHPDDWSMNVSGEVERPMTLNLDDLRRLPGRSVRAVTECAGNDEGFFDYERRGAPKPSRRYVPDLTRRASMKANRTTPTNDELAGEMGNTCALSGGEFTGVPLAEVLKRAGVKPGAQWVWLKGFDQGRPDPAVQYRSMGRADVNVKDPGVINYDKALPLAKAMDPDTLLAWAQNGEWMLHVHGAPLRCIVPGWSGNWWVKWLSQIEVTREMPACYHQTEYFVYGATPEDPVKPMLTAMGVRCIITYPLDEDSPLERATHAIRGLAWSGMGRIATVEVSVDGGESWAQAHIEEPRERWLWVRWSYLWTANQPGRQRILARATDEQGRVQPQTPWNYQRKHFDGIVPSDVTVE
jgi:DMSO/TMAO reductase YedYZ molybdopterin-dependent catalytic subunit